MRDRGVPSCVFYFGGGGHRSWCSVRCVCAPGIGGGLRILSATFSDFTIFRYVFSAPWLCLSGRSVRGLGSCLRALCGAILFGD